LKYKFGVHPKIEKSFAKNVEEAERRKRYTKKNLIARLLLPVSSFHKLYIIVKLTIKLAAQ
jgi:hypothetical protein